MTGKGAWWMTPVAPLKAMTMLTMKKEMATIEIWEQVVSKVESGESVIHSYRFTPGQANSNDTALFISLQARPRNKTDPIYLEANCQVAALNASEIQYAIILQTPHFLKCLGIGSRSLFVHLALPVAKADFGCSTFKGGNLRPMVPLGGRE